jgi:hypothetical protein
MRSNPELDHVKMRDVEYWQHINGNEKEKG